MLDPGSFVDLSGRVTHPQDADEMYVWLLVMVSKGVPADRELARETVEAAKKLMRNRLHRLLRTAHPNYFVVARTVWRCGVLRVEDVRILIKALSEDGVAPNWMIRRAAQMACARWNQPSIFVRWLSGELLD